MLQGRAPEGILDTYESERIAFARKLVRTTDQIFTFATAEGRLADILRTRIAPLIIPAAARVDALREWVFRTLSQLMIHYRGSPLSEGKAGEVHGGDRLPWVKGADNFGPLAVPSWQVHVYGSAPAELLAACGSQNLPLHVFDWCEAHAAAGFSRNAMYLIRPDTYVALAAGTSSPQALESYFKDRRLRP